MSRRGNGLNNASFSCPNKFENDVLFVVVRKEGMRLGRAINYCKLATKHHDDTECPLMAREWSLCLFTLLVIYMHSSTTSSKARRVCGSTGGGGNISSSELGHAGVPLKISFTAKMRRRLLHWTGFALKNAVRVKKSIV